jgi:hypothetical protein
MAYTTINKGSSYFDTSLWTGTGATQSITSLNFQPDWLWVKTRSTAANHRSQNSVIGVTKGMNPNQTSAEDTLTDCVTSFNSNGFTLGVDSQGYVNTSSRTYVGWSWLASNTTVANTSGTISSTVSVNTTAGFSIVSYTGNGTGGATVGHGLGVAPRMIILKYRNSGSYEWLIQHASIGNTVALFFNTASTSASSTYWNNTSPTSSVFTLGSSAALNNSGGTFIAYCFAEVKGYSKFGSYTGNSSADGTFVYTGFKPAFVMVKNTNYGPGTDWYIFDNKRNTYNVEDLYLNPNLSAAEATGVETDFLSNGFKLRHSSIAMNNSSYTYIYMAFAENPFVTSGGIPTTAR